MRLPDFKNELLHLKKGFHFVGGCDEAGLGPLAGPVVAAACVLDPLSIGTRRSKNSWYARVRDSKTISERERQILLTEILKHTIAWGVGIVSEKYIDKHNIRRAGLLAMRRAVRNMRRKLTKGKSARLLVFVDGNLKIPDLGTGVEQKCVIKGDAKILSVSAASIIAKVHRDNIMHKLHKKFPGYNFGKHKGYGTRAHLAAIKKLGPSPIHRKTFLKKITSKTRAVGRTRIAPKRNI